MNALFTYLRNVRAELAHVTWPSTRQAIAHTLIVIGISIVTALLVGLLDYVFTSGVGRLVGG
ncbi:MAG: preprotein translocase subunit SecE [Parcubacteria group bacterium 21-54-25]|nr:MAG: preprotein translocase subunit SecE [Parcubacteria group bacterium 21-54-25]